MYEAATDWHTAPARPITIGVYVDRRNPSRLAAEFGDHLDRSDDVPVKFPKFFGRHPQLLMNPGADGLDGELPQVL